MSGPYRVERNPTGAAHGWLLKGPTRQSEVYPLHEGDYANDIAEALNEGHAAGLAASGREAEIRGMERAVAIVQLVLINDSSDKDRRLTLALQAEIDKARALTPTEDREYQIAVEKLMKEPG